MSDHRLQDSLSTTGALTYENVLPIPRKIAKRHINISLGCNNCGQCSPSCSSQILKVIDGWLRPTDPSKCQVCEHCATACPSGSNQDKPPQQNPLLATEQRRLHKSWRLSDGPNEWKGLQR